MPKEVLVVATKKGFYHGIRDIGTEFYVPLDLVSPQAKTWFKPKDDAYFATSKPPTNAKGADESNQGDKPPAYSRMNKGDLTLEAAKLGIELTGEETNPQIVELLTAKQSQE